MQNQNYPYLTIFLLFRAGLHQEALGYCSQQSLDSVRNFGEALYSKYANTYKCNLPKDELSQFINRERTLFQTSSYDICRDALIHLMTGNTFRTHYEQHFFDYLL